LFAKKEYENAGTVYAAAFELNDDKGKVKHRYNAARSFAVTKNPDAAFIQLEKIVFSGKYYNTMEISNEKSFVSLHSDPKWKSLMKGVEANFQKLQEELNMKTRSGQ
jgi:hypothetical protein